MRRHDHSFAPEHSITLTEHIEEVTANIQRQRARITTLEHRKKASVITAVISACASVAMLLVAPGTTLMMILWLGLASFASLVAVATRNKLDLTQQLLHQNELYRSIIVEEAYSGKDIGPKM